MNAMDSMNIDELKSLNRELLESLKSMRTLAGLVTVRQVIEAGGRYIEAAGLNPWAINEGLATGDETIGLWSTDLLIERAEEDHFGSHEPDSYREEYEVRYDHIIKELNK